jgi:putative transposase
MSDYHHGSHTTFSIDLHIVWITEYRHKVWRSEQSSYRLPAEFPHLRKRFWERHVWVRGYFYRRSGNVTDEVIKAYIAQQSHDSDQGSSGVSAVPSSAFSAAETPRTAC